MPDFDDLNDDILDDVIEDADAEASEDEVDEGSDVASEDESEEAPAEPETPLEKLAAFRAAGYRESQFVVTTNGAGTITDVSLA